MRDVLRAIQCELARFERAEARAREADGRRAFDLRAATVQVGFATTTTRNGKFGISVAGVPAGGGILGGGVGVSTSSAASQDTVVRLDTRGDLATTAEAICALADAGEVRPTGQLAGALLALSEQLGAVNPGAAPARQQRSGLVLNDVAITLKTEVTRGATGSGSFSLGVVSVDLGVGRTDSNTQTIVVAAVEAVRGHAPGGASAPRDGSILRRDDLGALRLVPRALQRN